MSSVSSSLSSAAKSMFAGMYSGLDTETLVKQLTMATRNKIDKQNAAIQKLDWKKEAYRSITTKLNDFNSKYLDIANDKTYLFGSNFFSCTTVASSKNDYIKALGTNENLKDITVESVTQLASAAVIKGKAIGNVMSSSMSLDTSDLDDLAGQSVTFKFNGITSAISLSSDEISVIKAKAEADPDSDAVAQKLVIDKMNEKIEQKFGKNSFSLSYSEDTSSVNIKTGKTSDTVVVNGISDKMSDVFADFSVSSENGVSLSSELADIFPDLASESSVIINGVEIEINFDDTVSTVMSKINSSSAGVKMSYSSFTKSFTFESTAIGENARIEFEQGDHFTQAFAENFLGINVDHDNQTDSKFFDYDSNCIATATGKNAELTVTINGDTQTISRSSNTITLNNASFELVKTFNTQPKPTNPNDPVPADSIEPITFEVTRDIDQAVENIKSFITDFNDLLNTLNAAITQKPSKLTTGQTYDVLTQEQKDAMSETDIKNWEDKAKEGILYGDSALRDIYDQLRFVLEAPVGDNSLTLAQIGLESADWTSNGALSIGEGGEQKLREALTNNVQGVIDLFTAKTGNKNDKLASSEEAERFNQNGFAARLETLMYKTINYYGSEEDRGTLIKIAGFPDTLSDQQNEINTQKDSVNNFLSILKERLTKEEERHWASFSRLESAIAQMNAQTEAMNQQLSQLTASSNSNS